MIFKPINKSIFTLLKISIWDDGDKVPVLNVPVEFVIGVLYEKSYW